MEESTFSVEEYYQTRFEVNVTMPAFFFSTDHYVHGTIMANYTSGVPVSGNLTLKAAIRPIRPVYLRPEFQKKQRQYNRNDYEGNYYGTYNDQYGGGQYDNNPYGGNQYNRDQYGGQYGGGDYQSGPVPYNDYNRGTVEKYFNFVSISVISS